MSPGPRILIVDDNIPLLNSLARSLRQRHRSWSLITSSNPHQALVLIPSDVDVVVSELTMRGMDGAEFLDAVRHLSPFTMRLLFSTCREIPETVLESGVAHRLVSKPCPFHDLARHLGELIAIRERIQSLV